MCIGTMLMHARASIISASITFILSSPEVMGKVQTQSQGCNPKRILIDVAGLVYEAAGLIP
eukprot:XP_001710134.1 Hypothetical protein GL50803_113766 [Giardia lamblia ATCC 50803]